MADLLDSTITDGYNSDINDNDEQQQLNQSIKSKKSVQWEYEAPHYFDFKNLNNNDNDQMNGDDNYFLIDHEQDGDDSNEEMESIKENRMDESTRSLYSTPVSKFNANNDNNVNNNNTLYNFRETPLRSLYQNGSTPLRETKSLPFGRRKSCSSRKSIKKVDLTITATTTTTLTTIDTDDQQQQQHNESSRRETFDMKQIEVAINELSIVDQHQQQQQEMKTIDDQMKDVGKNSNDQPLNNDQEQVNEGPNQPVELPAIAEEESMDNFHEISNNELDENPADDPAAVVAAQTNLDQAQSKSKRKSYLVTSPVVRFSIANMIGTNDVEGGKQIDQDVTPKPNNEIERRRLMIKNRKATPMFNNDGKNRLSLKNNNNSLTINNQNRSQKYWKRFSRSITDDDNNGNDGGQQSTLDKENAEPNVQINDNRTDVRMKTPEMKKSTASTSTTTTTIKNGRKSMSAASINRLAALPKRIQTEKPSQRYVSLAEQTQKFLRSARQYQPKGLWLRKKQVTKPHPPRLLTALRSENRRRIENEKKSLNNQANSEAIDGPSKPKSQEIKSLKPPKTMATTKMIKKPLTKAHTPIFVTEYRSKLYQLKHINDNNHQNDENGSNNKPVMFRARPMPDFKKIQARAAAVAAAVKTKNGH